MKVKELIRELKKLDQNLPVRAYSHTHKTEFELLDSVCEALRFKPRDKAGVVLHFDARHL